MGIFPCRAQDSVEILVVLKPNAVLNQLPEGVISARHIGRGRVIRMTVSKDRVEEVIRELKEREGVQSVERSHKGRFEDNSSTEVLKDSDWYKEIRAEKIRELSSGTGVIVAVIDTGIDLQNSDFSSHASVNSREIGGDGIDNDGNGYVCLRHGNWRGGRSAWYESSPQKREREITA